jgi:hypothetical protein
MENNMEDIVVGQDKKIPNHLQRQVQITRMNAQITLVSYDEKEDMEYLTSKAVNLMEAIDNK